MATIKEQIQALYDEINKTQKNKATNAHIGKLKAKIAQLKLKEEKAAASAKAGGPAKDSKSRNQVTHRLHWSAFLQLESQR